MDFGIMLRYGLFLQLLSFTLLYSLWPLRRTLRFSRPRTALIAGFFLLLLISLLSLLGALTGLPAIWLLALGLLFLFGLYFFLNRDETIRKIFCFLNASMIMANAMVFGTLAAAPWELNNQAAVLLPPSAALCLACALLLALLYFKTLTVQLPYLLSSEALGFNWRTASLAPLVITLIFFFITPRSAQVVMTGRTRITSLAFLPLGSLAILLLYRTLWRVAQHVEENTKLREKNSLMEMERKRYEELRIYMNESRALRHDFRQHLLVMGEYAKNGESEKLAAYIRQFTASYAEHRGSFAANAAVDAVAAHYDAQAQEQQTHILWKIELPAQLPIKESDFITIFGNLTENALQAVRDLPAEKRNIHVTARMLSEAMLGLSVKNPYQGQIKLDKNGLPRSDKAGHGIGLSSVSAAVGRYRGALDLDTAEGVFSAGVLLYTDEVI
ncbi:MAG: sensor histidine kinase [Lachnospiraceae bacterium]|nr:sensor histidine kinase [Lachnospiraceae bacterium]